VSAGPRLPDRGILAKLCGDGGVIQPVFNQLRGGLVLSRNYGDASPKCIFNELRPDSGCRLHRCHSPLAGLIGEAGPPGNTERPRQVVTITCTL